VLAAGVCTYTLLQSTTVPALPHLQAELGASQAGASWILTAFLISASVATPIAGRLGDAFGKVRVLVISLLLLSAGALLAAIAPNLMTMVLARTVQGMAGGVLPLAFGIVRDELPPARVPSAVALISSLMSVGFGTGIVVSGSIVAYAGHRVLFLLPAVAGLAAAAIVARHVPESPVRGRQHVPVLPALLLAGWLVTGLVGVSGAPHAGWASSRTLGLLLAAVTLLALWALVESRIPVPLIDLRLLLDRGVVGANLVALLVGVSMYAAFGFLPQLMQTPVASGYGLGLSMPEAGLITLPNAVLSCIGGLFSTRLVRVVGERVLIAAGCVLSAVGLGVVAVAHAHAADVVLANMLCGLGGGMVFAVLANVVVAAAPRGSTSVAAGLNANLRTIGGAIGSAVMASVVTHTLLPGGLPAEGGYVAGFSLLAVMSLAAGAAAVWLIPASAARRQQEPLHVERGVAPLDALAQQ
jgi:MFS family permease